MGNLAWQGTNTLVTRVIHALLSLLLPGAGVP
jgi:hypothetical protein